MHNSNDLFSIIIPTYNHANYIRRCLDSLLIQTFSNWEAIVVNNFSEDNTIEIVKGYKDPRIQIISIANGGVIAVSRNKGISEAKGNWICFLDSDDWWYPNKLEVSLQYLSDYDLIHHDLDIYSKEGKSNRIAKGRILNDNIAKDLIVNGNGLVNSSVVLRKDIVDQLGNITEDKELIAVEDYDYWIRTAKITNRFKYINQSFGAYWVGENISNSKKQIDRAKRLLEKYMPLLSPTEQDNAISNYHFIAGRMYHSLSLFSEAKASYLKALRLRNSIRNVKAIFGLFMCQFKIK